MTLWLASGKIAIEFFCLVGLLHPNPPFGR